MSLPDLPLVGAVSVFSSSLIDTFLAGAGVSRRPAVVHPLSVPVFVVAAKSRFRRGPGEDDEKLTLKKKKNYVCLWCLCMSV